MKQHMTSRSYGKTGKENNFPKKIFKNKEEYIPIPNQGKVIAIINYSNFENLLSSIRSIKDQTYKNIETIVVGNNMEDENLSSLQEMNVKYVKANNFDFIETVKSYNGKYVAFAEDKDVWFPNKIEKQMQYLRQSSCKMSCTNAKFGKEYWSYNDKQPQAQILFREYLPSIITEKLLDKKNYFLNSSVLIEKDILKKITIEEKDLYLDIWKKIIKFTNCVFTNEPLIYCKID